MLLSALLLGGVTGLFLNSKFPSLYQSEIIIHVDDSVSNETNGFGISLDSPSLIKVRNLIQSTRLANGLIKSNGLVDLYGIPAGTADRYERTLLIFKERLQVSTKNNSTLQVIYTDRDPIVARNLLNQLYRNLEQAIQKERRKELNRKSKVLGLLLKDIETRSDSTSEEILKELHLLSERQDLSEWNTAYLRGLGKRFESSRPDYQQLSKQYELALYQKKAGVQPNVLLTQKAIKDVRNSPTRTGLLRVIVCSFLGLILGALIVVVFVKKEIEEQFRLLKQRSTTANGSDWFNGILEQGLSDGSDLHVAPTRPKPRKETPA